MALVCGPDYPQYAGLKVRDYRNGLDEPPAEAVSFTATAHSATAAAGPVAAIGAEAVPANARRPLARLASGAGRLWRGAVALVLPPLCPACREPLGSEAGLCPGCWGRLSFITPPYCPRLGIPFAFDPGPGVLSLEAIADPPAYGRARAAVRFDDVSRRLVHFYKYGDRLDLAPLLGRFMAAAGRDLLAEADALVPVPLHWRRLWLRRFNQSAALAAAIGRQTGTEVLCEALARRRPTVQQVGLSRNERSRNVQGAFAVPPAQRALIAGRRLVLIDDVLTSGATVEACARALTRAGAQSVDVLVFARVVDAVRTPI